MSAEATGPMHGLCQRFSAKLRLPSVALTQQR